MVLRCDFCVEPRLVRVDLKSLEFFNGMLFHSYVAMLKHFGQLGPFRANIVKNYKIMSNFSLKFHNLPDHDTV